MENDRKRSQFKCISLIRCVHRFALKKKEEEGIRIGRVEIVMSSTPHYFIRVGRRTPCACIIARLMRRQLDAGHKEMFDVLTLHYALLFAQGLSGKGLMTLEGNQ